MQLRLRIVGADADIAALFDDEPPAGNSGRVDLEIASPTERSDSSTCADGLDPYAGIRCVDDMQLEGGAVVPMPTLTELQRAPWSQLLTPLIGPSTNALL